LSIDAAAPARSLRFGDLVFYTLAMTLAIRWIPVAAAAGPGSILLWVLALFGFMAPLCLGTAELTTRFEGDGGLYAWTRRTYGPFWGYICGWLYWTCNLPFFSGVLFFVVNVLAETVGGRWGAALRTPAGVAGASAVLATVIGLAHLRGLGTGKWLSNFGAAAASALFLLIIVSGGWLALQGRSATDFVHARYSLPPNADTAILWATVVFGYGGPEALAFLKNDVDGGVRQILKVLLVVGILLVFAFSLATLGMLSILSAGEISRLSGLPDTLRLSLSRLGLGVLAPATLFGLAAALLGGYSAWFGVAARLPFAAGADRLLPESFARRDPKTGAPRTAILVQIAAVVVLVVVSQAGANLKAAYDFLVSMTLLSYILPFLFLFAVLISVQNEAPPPGAWTMPGGPVAARLVGVVGLVCTATALLCTLVPSPDAPDKTAAVIKIIVASLVLVGAGAGAYLVSRRGAVIAGARA
jgi:glutamate:GABA antiporter